MPYLMNFPQTSSLIWSIMTFLIIGGVFLLGKKELHVVHRREPFLHKLAVWRTTIRCGVHLHGCRWDMEDHQLWHQAARGHLQDEHRCFIYMGPPVGRNEMPVSQPSLLPLRWRGQKFPLIKCFFSESPSSHKWSYNGSCPKSIEDSSWLPFRNHCYAFHMEVMLGQKEAMKRCQKGKPFKKTPLMCIS